MGKLLLQLLLGKREGCGPVRGSPNSGGVSLRAGDDPHLALLLRIPGTMIAGHPELERPLAVPTEDRNRVSQVNWALNTKDPCKPGHHSAYISSTAPQGRGQNGLTRGFRENVGQVLALYADNPRGSPIPP